MLKLNFANFVAARVFLLAVIACLSWHASVISASAQPQPASRLELKSTDKVLWRSRNNETFLIINVFAHEAKLDALPEVERNSLLINTALVEGALMLERPENQGMTSLSALLVSMRDMSEYGGSNTNWKQVGAGTITRSSDRVSMTDTKFAGALPSPLPTVAYPYKEAASITAAHIRFRMPEKLYVAVGEPLTFFYENILVSRSIEDFVYTPTGNSVGFAAQGRRGLVFQPGAIHVGEHDLFIKVADWDGKVIAEGATRVVVVPEAMSWQPSAGEPVRILTIGHSLPSMYYPAYILDQLSAPGNPAVRFVGGIKYWYGKLPDFRNNPDIESMAHQASPGYSLHTVLNLYTDEPPANPNMPSKSPFIFKNSDGKPVFDIKRYFNETLGGKPPHFILLNIGDNDTFDFDPDAPDAALEAKFRSDLSSFLDALRSIAPDAVIGAIMPNTYNYSDRSFLHNYGPKYTRWRQIQNRQRYIELMSEVAKARGDFQIVPSHFSVDSVDGMPWNSGTHFNAVGARQFATSIYGWLKGQFALKGGAEKTVAVTPVPAPGNPVAAPAPVNAVAIPAAAAAAQPAPRPGWFERTRNRILKMLSFN